MHIFFSGIGGTAIGPLAMIAAQAGYTVSGSDKRGSQYIDYLRGRGITSIHIGQSYEQIESAHKQQPIDWYVYSSAVSIENPDAPELQFCKDNGIKTSKRDELINQIIADKRLKLIAVAGTHGKTTATAMAVWLFKQLDIPISYSVGAKIPFGEMGQFVPGSEYFIYEADEFDRNFLAFKPYMSLITGISWDHHEIFPTLLDYQQAFLDFMSQSQQNIAWQDDIQRFQQSPAGSVLALDAQDTAIDQIKLAGLVNRQDAWLVASVVYKLTSQPLETLIGHMNRFPGLSRRFEQLAKNLYTDYAHTPEKIRGCLQTASELSQNVVVVYEPLTDRRQHFIKDQYKDLFAGVKKLYWVPSYLAREDPSQPILTPAELIGYMDNKDIAEPAELNNQLKDAVEAHRQAGDLVVAISGGGGGGLDEWLRQSFSS